VPQTLHAYVSGRVTSTGLLPESAGDKMVLLSDWSSPILAVVFISWGLGFVGVAAWSIHKEYKARQTQKTEATPPVVDDMKLGETGETQVEAPASPETDAKATEPSNE
jgi:hypothetical protein